MGYPYKFTTLLAITNLVGTTTLISAMSVRAATASRLEPARVATEIVEIVESISPQSVLLAQESSANLSDEQKERLSTLLGDAQRKIESGDYAGAVALYQQAIQVDRENTRIYSGIAYLQLQQGDFESAAEYYRQALDRDPRNLPFHYGLAHSLFMDERYEQSASAYRDLINIDPRAADAFIGLGALSCA